MKTTTHNYRGYVIKGFSLRQLGDPQIAGMSYNVYALEHGESLSSSECLTRLSEAKAFIDTLAAGGAE